MTIKRIISISLISLLLLGCGSGSKKSDVTEQVGNTTGNLLNGAWVVKDKNNIYYVQTNQYLGNGRLVKLDKKGNTTKIADAFSLSNLYIRNNYIYYGMNQTDLYRIKTDGSDKSKLSDKDIVNFAHIYGDWIYYCNGSYRKDSVPIYKMRLDGTEKTKLVDGMCLIEDVTEDWIYYKSNGDTHYRTHKDGSSTETINIHGIDYPHFVGEWIYYRDINDGSLCKVKIDGSTETKLDHVNCIFVNVDGDWIYYCDKDENMNLYKIKTDGSQKTLLSSDSCRAIQVVGEWIYYQEGSETSLCKIKNDGTNKTKIDKFYD